LPAYCPVFPPMPLFFIQAVFPSLPFHSHLCLSFLSLVEQHVDTQELCATPATLLSLYAPSTDHRRPGSYSNLLLLTSFLSFLLSLNRPCFLSPPNNPFFYQIAGSAVVLSRRTFSPFPASDSRSSLFVPTRQVH